MSQNQPSVYAKISKETYGQKTSRKDIDGYTFISQASNQHISVFFNKDNNEFVIAHRGTRIADNDDIEADLMLALGKLNKSKLYPRRLSKTKGLIQDIKEADPEAKITLVGHSLGGSTAIHSLSDDYINDNVNKVVTFNPGVTPIKEGFFGTPAKVENYIIHGDPITSYGHHVGKIITVSPKKDNFTADMVSEIVKQVSSSEVLGNIAGGLVNHSIENFINEAALNYK